MPTKEHDLLDVLIVGGGPVGASLALGLSRAGFELAMLEASPREIPAPSYDDRPVALAYGARRIFEGLDLWSEIGARAEPIRHIHVSDRGHFGVARLAAAEYGLEALGYVVTARDLGAVLEEALAAESRVERRRPAVLEGLRVERDAVEVEVRENGASARLRTRLLVAADGGRSSVRRLLGIAELRRDYHQLAVTANVTPQRHHHGSAFERFTDSGPIALLPMAGGRCGLVWSSRSEQAERLLELSDEHFLEALAEHFGTRLGRFVRVGRRASYPLERVRSAEQVRPRVAVIGNAAHTLHPVAGQGFNLGLRDAAVLAEVIVDGLRTGADPGEDGVLARYARWRRADQRSVELFTDGLVSLFGSRRLALAALRNAGLLGLDVLPGLKRRFARFAMGLGGRQPRLGRGLAL